jgi:hypothetical protein
LLWSSASTPMQLIPRRRLYPEAATNKSAPTDTDKQTGQQTGMPPPPGSDAGPKAARPYPSGRLAAQLNRAGLVLLIAGCVLVFLLPITRRQSRGRAAMAAVWPCVVLRLRERMNTAISSDGEPG